MTDAITASADLAHRPGESMLCTTVFAPDGYRVARTIGLVRGNTIRARHLGKDIMAALKSLFGGEISEYTKMLAESREQSLDRMRAEAVARGANAIIGVQFTTCMVMQGTSEILAYGTAVVLEPVKG
jgi:uncharacterized protein YbjQ (UPF0145 family)